MKPILIMSFRTGGMDTRPAQQLLNIILDIKNEATFRDIPITICYQTDPNGFTLDRANENNAIEKIHEKANHSTSNLHTGKSSSEEHALDLSEYRLLQGIRLLQEAYPLNIKVIPSDLPDIARTTGEHVAAWQARIINQNPQRQNAMVSALINAENIEKGGIIFDYGDFSHLAEMKRILANEPLLNDTSPKPDVRFLSIVPEEMPTSLKRDLVSFAQKFKLAQAENALATNSNSNATSTDSNPNSMGGITTVFDNIQENNNNNNSTTGNNPTLDPTKPTAALFS